MNTEQKVPVSVIVGMRNSSTTIVNCLEGLASQDYPMSEIIVVDNVSSDNSVALVEEFAKRCPVPVRLIKQTVNGGLATSYNTGAALAVAPLLILMHSDGAFPSAHELADLVKPLQEDPEIVASCPILLMPRDVWDRYPFWQKRLFACAVGREVSSFCGKFDCIRKDFFFSIGGYNTGRYTAECGYGGEDSDVLFKILKQGKLARSQAHVIHLHDLSNNYGLRQLFSTRKMLARTYGKIIQFQGVSLTDGRLLFFVRPALVIILFVPHLFWCGVFLLLLFSITNSRAMYQASCSLRDPRILMLPFVDIALIFYETIWFFEGLVTPSADVKTMKSGCVKN